MSVELRDYVVPKVDDSDEVTDETLVNFCLFFDCDPISYEIAAQDDGWI